MMLRSRHRYVAEATARDGRPLGELLLETDFAPAAECSHLQAMRAAAVPTLTHYGAGEVEPVIDDERGPPYVQGIRVRFDAADPIHVPATVPWRFFQPAVERAAQRLVDAGKLASGDTFVYRVCAFPLASAGPAPDMDARDAGDASVALALERAALDELASGAARLGTAAWDRTDFPVFVRRAVLDEATRMARAAGERETGGILVGHLRRDTRTPEIHAEITAQIPATQARAERTSLGFTPETWAAMNDALALRARGERMLGWWHAHPHWCKRCPASRRRHCALAQPFFSRDDCDLHRCVFDAAFNVALLLSDTGADALSYDLFGWRHGSIAARGCYVLPEPRDAAIPTWSPGAGDSAARILPLRENQHEH